MSCDPGGRAAEVLVARLGRPWGRHGELLVELDTDWPAQRFRSGAGLTAELRSGERRSLRVRALTTRGTRTMVAFDGVDGIGAAEPLAGARLLAPREGVPLERDEVHVADLPGLAVVLADGTVVGHVEAVAEGVASDLVEVRTTDGSRRLVPLVEPIVLAIEPEAGRMVVDPPAGLLDDGASEATPGAER
ncbi:MAG: hypothetical protein Kow0062_14920 [Acidobacteriota bacterium]